MSRMIEISLYVLEVLRYIKKENPFVRRSPRIVLRNTDDIKTSYTLNTKRI